MTTKELESKLYNAVQCRYGNPSYPKNGWYSCFEVAMPPCDGVVETFNRERVDFLSLESHGWRYADGIWRCYELKVSKADFFSKAKKSFYGHLNYFVIPDYLYEQIKDNIPEGIGIYVGDSSSTAVCRKKAKKRELIIPHEDLVFALMQSLAREYQKSHFISEPD
jgi:hypothetical protein